MKKEKTLIEWIVKSMFLTYFDGLYNIPPKKGVSDTFTMGVTDLSYDESTKTLTVELRRPGLLIGKSGSTLKTFEEYANVTVKIKEKLLQKGKP